MKRVLFFASLIPLGASMIVLDTVAVLLLWVARRIMALACVYDELLRRYEYWCFGARQDPMFKRTLREIYQAELDNYVP